MSRRMVVRGGKVVDGSGMPAFNADVEIVDGTITTVGRITDTTDAEVIDATGLVVAPGFVDIHTHYDAQLHFEPTASPSSWHGFTTVAIGNCGFSLAPCKPEDLAWTSNMLSRVEGMSAEALLDGVTFTGGSMGDFLGGLEGKIGVNIAAYAGHCAIRRYVMGEAASEREATADEIAAMVELLEQQLDEGAIGLSTSQLDLHADHEGKPVPANLASAEEILALCATLANRRSGAIEIFPRSYMHADGMDEADADLVMKMAEVSGKIIHGNVTGYFQSSPDSWKRSVEVAEQAAARGLRYLPMLILNPKGVHFAFDSAFLFDEYPTWRSVLVLPMDERRAKLASPEVREVLRAELSDPSLGSWRYPWDEVQVVWTADPSMSDLHGLDISVIAEKQGKDPLDVMLDIAVQDNLLANFAIRRKDTSADRAVIDSLVNNPLLTPGSSDGGAHLQTFCGVDFATRLIADHVPDRMTLERAISRLTFESATSLGLWDRGLIRPGMAGDLVILDPERVAVDAVEMRHDFPTGASRLVFEAKGYHATIVNGEVLIRDGKPTGALPGNVLRPAA